MSGDLVELAQRFVRLSGNWIQVSETPILCLPTGASPAAER